MIQPTLLLLLILLLLLFRELMMKCRRCHHSMCDRQSCRSSADSQQYPHCLHSVTPNPQSDTERYSHCFGCYDVTCSHFMSGPDCYEVAVLAGSGQYGRLDGSADECQFSYPRGMALDESSHSCFVTDTGSRSIRRMTFKG